jgi:hypothetical protein
MPNAPTSACSILPGFNSSTATLSCKLKDSYGNDVTLNDAISIYKTQFDCNVNRVYMSSTTLIGVVVDASQTSTNTFTCTYKPIVEGVYTFSAKITNSGQTPAQIPVNNGSFTSYSKPNFKSMIFYDPGSKTWRDPKDTNFIVILINLD